MIRFAVLIMVATALAGCIETGRALERTDDKGPKVSTGGRSEPPSLPGRYGGRMTAIEITDPKTFNIWLSTDAGSGEVVGPLYDSLNWRNSYTLQFEPRLAGLPKISSDGLTYTYRLRDGLVWSDGEPLNADDVTFTLDVLFDPKIDTPFREGLLIDTPAPDGTIKRQAFRYRKIDDRTVEFQLPCRYAPAINTLIFPIAPRHKLEAAYRAGKFNTTWGANTPPSELVSSGPWVMKEYVPGQRVVYRRNPHFWRHAADGRPLPYLDEFVFLIVRDWNTGALKFRSEEADAFGMRPEDYPSLKRGEASGNYTVYDRGLAWGFEDIVFNENPGAKLDRNLLSLFQDVRFRRAVSHVVNRQRIADDLLLGFGEPLYGPESPANRLIYNPNIPTFPYAPSRAKALLAEIGLRDSDGNGFLEYRGKEVRFNILTNVENDIRKGIATIIADDLKQIGINAQFTPISFNDLILRLDVPPHEWEAAVLGITGSPEPTDGKAIWRSSGEMHEWWPRQKKPATPWEAELDRVFTDGPLELDPAKRKKIYDRYQSIVAEQEPFIFTVAGHQLTAVRNRLRNVKPCSLSPVIWNSEEIFDADGTRMAP